MLLLLPISVLAVTIQEPILNSTQDTISINWLVDGTNTSADISLFYREVGTKDFILYFEEKNKELPYNYNHTIQGLSFGTNYQLFLEVNNDNNIMRSDNYLIATQEQTFSLGNLIEENLILTLITLLVLVLLAVFLLNSWLLGGLIMITSSFVAFTHINWLIGFIILVIGFIMLFKEDK